MPLINSNAKQDFAFTPTMTTVMVSVSSQVGPTMASQIVVTDRMRTEPITIMTMMTMITLALVSV